MKIFLDSARLNEVKAVRDWGVLAGVTTNPSLIAREGADFHSRIKHIAEIVQGPVSAEVIATDAKGMVEEGKQLAALDPHVVVKVPMGAQGLHAASALSGEGIPVNMTLVFSANQALLAARAGAAYVSPFVGRLDDAGHDGMGVVADCAKIFARHNITTQVLAASIRHPRHVTEAALAGAHAATIPFTVLESMLGHPMTDIGLDLFLADWRHRGEH